VVLSARQIAPRFVFALFERSGKFTARSRAEGINAAGNRVTHFSLQCYAAHVVLVGGSLHYPEHISSVVGELLRYGSRAALSRFFRFPPVKRNAEIGATGAAGLAGMNWYIHLVSIGANSFYSKRSNIRVRNPDPVYAAGHRSSPSAASIFEE
jgi:hypothetical protein